MFLTWGETLVYLVEGMSLIVFYLAKFHFILSCVQFNCETTTDNESGSPPSTPQIPFKLGSPVWILELTLDLQVWIHYLEKHKNSVATNEGDTGSIPNQDKIFPFSN